MRRGFVIRNVSMPEGPEVQSIVTDLKSLIIGRRILDLVTNEYTRRLFGNLDGKKLRDRVVGFEIIDVCRRGKNIVLRLSSDFYLVIHLRMTGQMFLRDDVPKYCRLTLKLDGEGDLHLADVRTFATCEVWGAENFATFEIKKKIGFDALSPTFSIRDLQLILVSQRSIYTVLLDQTKISGLGNIYVNESLFEAGINPLRKAAGLTDNEVKKLHKSIKVTLTRAVNNRGTTFSDYRLPGGEMGSFQKFLKVFRRAGEPCLKCKSDIQREKLGGRSMFYCEQCQK
jgi:formamidopyrimidine-DNA glycosylase